MCLCCSVSGVPRSFLEGCLAIYLTASPYLQCLNSSRSHIIGGIHICSTFGFVFCWSLLKLQESFLLFSPSGLSQVPVSVTKPNHLLFLDAECNKGCKDVPAELCEWSCVYGAHCGLKGKTCRLMSLHNLNPSQGCGPAAGAYIHLLAFTSFRNCRKGGKLCMKNDRTPIPCCLKWRWFMLMWSLFAGTTLRGQHRLHQLCPSSLLSHPKALE